MSMEKIFEKRNIRKWIELYVVTHAFNPSSEKREAGRSLSLKPSWSTDPISGQPNLGRGRNYQK